MANTIYSLGAIPDNPDKRDTPKLVKHSRVPDRFNLFAYAGKPYQQGKIGSCTGQTLAKCEEVMKRRIAPNPRGPVQLASPLFTYALAREKANWPDHDNGAFLRDVLKVSTKIGVLAEDLYTGKNSWQQRPTQAELSLGHHGRIKGYERISVLDQDPVNDMRIVLAEENLPILIGVRLFDGVYGSKTTRSGLIEMPGESSRQIGGHAMALLGYDDQLQLFSGMNSWGDEWGDDGKFYLPYDYVRKYANDIWTFTKNYY